MSTGDIVVVVLLLIAAKIVVPKRWAVCPRLRLRGNHRLRVSAMRRRGAAGTARRPRRWLPSAVQQGSIKMPTRHGKLDTFGGIAPLPAVALMAAGLAGCSTERLTEPPQTATEELLVSTAVDRAVAQLKPQLPAAAKVFVDPQYIDTAGPDAALLPKYTIAAIRDELLRQGELLVDDKKTADIVVEPRSGAQSVDHHSFLIGLPAIPVPVPFSGTVTLPEIALYKRDRQAGIAKLAVSAYLEKTGGFAASTGDQYGVSQHTYRVVLIFFSSTEEDILPEELQKETR
jgi:hypothetical protein